jgi:hypothetical protein
MKILCRLLDQLLIRAISLTGIQVYGLDVDAGVDVWPEVVDPESLRRRPAPRLRFVLS